MVVAGGDLSHHDSTRHGQRHWESRPQPWRRLPDGDSAHRCSPARKAERTKLGRAEAENVASLCEHVRRVAAGRDGTRTRSSGQRHAARLASALSVAQA